MSAVDTVTTRAGGPRSAPDGSCLSARLEMLTGPRWPIAVLTLAGELDIATQMFAEIVLRAAVDTAPGPVVVDLAGLQFSSVHGLEQLAAPACTAGGHEYVAAGLTPHLQRLAARLCTPDRPIRYPDAASAVTALRADQTPPPGWRSCASA